MANPSTTTVPMPFSHDVEKHAGVSSPTSQSAKNTPSLSIRIGHVLGRVGIYQQLFFLVLTANIIAGTALFSIPSTTNISLAASAAGATSVNLAAAILIRQDWAINLLFACVWNVPHSAPLWLRTRLAKVYEFGGVHSGCATASILWFLALSACLTRAFVDGSLPSVALIGLDYALLVLLLAISISSVPAVRTRHHNVFERLHRFAGWSTLALFWAMLVVFVAEVGASQNQSIGDMLIRSPAFWFAVLSTILTILPWIFLRKVQVEPERLSEHAIRLHLSERVPAFKGVALSSSPLSQWHAFAAFPDDDGERSSILVSNAGDWTKSTIDNPKATYYLRGFPRTGVLAMAQLFTRVVIVATGSGIGPVLSISIQLSKGESTKCRVIWSTPNPRRTFGKKICGSVKSVDPNALVIDTRVTGRPDLVRLAYGIYRESNAEAVFVISNKKVTDLVLSKLRGRGVPAFAPIFDS